MQACIGKQPERPRHTGANAMPQCRAATAPRRPEPPEVVRIVHIARVEVVRIVHFTGFEVVRIVHFTTMKVLRIVHLIGVEVVRIVHNGRYKPMSHEGGNIAQAQSI